MDAEQIEALVDIWPFLFVARSKLTRRWEVHGVAHGGPAVVLASFWRRAEAEALHRSMMQARKARRRTA